MIKKWKKWWEIRHRRERGIEWTSGLESRDALEDVNAGEGMERMSFRAKA